MISLISFLCFYLNIWTSLWNSRNSSDWYFVDLTLSHWWWFWFFQQYTYLDQCLDNPCLQWLWDHTAWLTLCLHWSSVWLTHPTTPNCKSLDTVVHLESILLIYIIKSTFIIHLLNRLNEQSHIIKFELTEVLIILFNEVYFLKYSKYS